MTNPLRCPHENMLIDLDGNLCEPKCGCKLIIGKNEPPHPLPWIHRTLLITDANGDPVIHLGDQTFAGKAREGAQLAAIAGRIVEAVNAQPRIVQALSLAKQFGQIDGAHHKAWVIDQIVQILTRPDYEQFLREYRCEDGETYTWDQGIAP